METAIAVTRLSSLAHQTRLDIFRLLVKAGPKGMAAGELASQTGSLANTLSNNLTILSAAGHLVRGVQIGGVSRAFAQQRVTTASAQIEGFFREDPASHGQQMFVTVN